MRGTPWLSQKIKKQRTHSHFNILLDKDQWKTLLSPDGISFNHVLRQTRSWAIIYWLFTVYFVLMRIKQYA